MTAESFKKTHPSEGGVVAAPTSEPFPSSKNANTRKDRKKDPETLDDVEIERLGRQRPEIFKTSLAELGFVLTILFSLTMSEYFISGFNIILPSVSVSLDIPEQERTWPAAVINLTTSCLLMPFTRVADRYGAKWVFLAGHVWLAAWSLIAGFSQNPVMLTVCRALQGLGPSAFMPTGFALLASAYRPGPRKNLMFSLYGAFGCLGFYSGILLGAISAQLLFWRWYFWFGTIMCVAVALGAVFFIPSDLGHIDRYAKMDWWGVVTIVPSVILIVFAFTQGSNSPDGWRTPYVYVTLLVGLILAGAAVYVQGWVSEQPLVPAAVFRPKHVKRILGAMFCGFGVYGLYLFYASFYIEVVLHIQPVLAAAWFTPLAVGGILLGISGGFLLHIFPNRALLIFSQIGFLLSVLLFAIIPEREDGKPSTTFLYWAYVFPAMICGTIGIDITFNIVNIFLTTAMPLHLQSAASGIINSIMYLGMAFWLGIAQMAVSTTIQHQGEIGQSKQYRIGFWTGVAMAGTSLLLVLTVRIGTASASLTADEKAELRGDSTDSTDHEDVAKSLSS